MGGRAERLGLGAAPGGGATLADLAPAPAAGAGIVQSERRNQRIRRTMAGPDATVDVAFTDPLTQTQVHVRASDALQSRGAMIHAS